MQTDEQIARRVVNTIGGMPYENLLSILGDDAKHEDLWIFVAKTAISAYKTERLAHERARESREPLINPGCGFVSPRGNVACMVVGKHRTHQAWDAHCTPTMKMEG